MTVAKMEVMLLQYETELTYAGCFPDSSEPRSTNAPSTGVLP